ncbi:sensor histidine kinase [Polaribacter sp.]|uniref:sensor histidine kinase n=1 Tax=Polaribacter sp. TaxID=1920175 RepID=UPI003F6B0663
MSVKNWTLLIINSLVLLVVLSISFSFYSEFSKVLDKRILLHLNSIKTLKQIQLERLINKEWKDFNNSDKDFLQKEIILSKDKYQTTGIFDLTHLHPSKKTSIALIKVNNNTRYFKIIDYQKIKNILTERTGMGSSGESYIIGSDYRLRSQSRFFPNKTPYEITAKTIGAINGLKNKEGVGIFKDYRNIAVYSAYNKLNLGKLNWVILSEIDVKEIQIPLKEMRSKLLILTLITLLVSITISLFLTKIITNPLKKLHNLIGLMAKGSYNEKTQLKNSPKEITEMNVALDNLSEVISSAVNFSVEIGNMNLNSKYKPKGKNDLLGQSLLKMRNKLKAYRTLESEINTTNKRMLIEGLESERKRLARELHDGLGPLLTTLKLNIQNKVENGENKETIKNIIDNTIKEIRQMTNVLMPTSLDKFGIGATLINYVQSIQDSISFPINFENLTKTENSNITKEQEIHLFRITQELINNSIKHANATLIKISLTEFDEFLSLFYFDNGIGFNTQKVTTGSGLANIKNRVEICNGILKINSEKGKTTFEIEMPIKNNKND